MKDKGFTLVELLAVILILGLLIGIGIYTLGNISDMQLITIMNQWKVH